MRWRLWIALLLICGAIAWLTLQSDSPSHDRDWVTYLSRLNTATSTATSTTLSNVRDWRYAADGTITDRTWRPTTTIAHTDITRVWFLLERFGQFPITGHTFLSFELATGEVYSFSIEARREWGEDYSVWQGLFNQYELSYVWTTERDAVARRLYHHDGALYMYPLNLSGEARQNLFRTLVAATNELASTPRFYNTLTANCTNLLARSINEAYPGRVPYDIAWNLPGTSDRFLMKIGYIDGTGTVSERTATAALNPYESLLSEPALAENPTAFSAALRATLAPSLATSTPATSTSTTPLAP